jgi:polyhydroxybutyrate depolymerase
VPIARILSLVLIAVSATALMSPPVLAGSPSSLRASRACNRPQAPGTGMVPLASAGQLRPFLLHVPRRYDGHDRLPLVLNLHGSGSNGGRQMVVSQMAAIADRRHFAVAAPNGAVPFRSGYAWNVPGVPLLGGDPVPEGTPSDERYLLDVIRQVRKTVCTDARRVYLTGFSGGARMSSQMACDFSDRIAAIAPVGGLRSGVPQQTATGAWEPAPSTCEPRKPVPVLAFHGTADDVNPYAGNDVPRWGYSVETALARWAGLNRCTRGPWTSQIIASVQLISYSKCRRGAGVGLYRQEGGGHIWPSGNSTEVIASSLIWRFFAKHELPAKR